MRVLHGEGERMLINAKKVSRAKTQRRKGQRQEMRILLLLLAFFLCGFATLREIPLAADGVVFEDADGDGIRDPGEAGMAGVAVTDQSGWAITDEQGRFRFEPLGGYGVVSVSWPDGYFPSGAFWKAVAGRSAEPA